MLFAQLFALASVAAAIPHAGLGPKEEVARSTKDSIVSYTKPASFKRSTSFATTSNVVPLTRKRSSGGSKLVRAARASNVSSVEGTYGLTNVSTVAEGQVLITSIQAGDEWFEAVVDTGSSDTWFMHSGFQCKDTLGGNKTESYCKFGKAYETSCTFTKIPDENFKVTYADGEGLTGILGTEKITLANITVFNQTIGVVDIAAWDGDGISSGLIGLAYPVLTSAFNGTNASSDSRSSQVEYSPIFTSMYTEGEVESLFTLTLERGNGTSTLALGGLPPAEPGYENAEFTSVDIEIMKLNPFLNPKYATENSYYTIIPDGFVYRNATTAGSGNWTSPVAYENGSPEETLNTTYPTIVDSGTSLIYLPQAQVLYINAAFDPSTTYDEQSGYDVIPCNATAPEFGVVIGGETFYVDAQDMILDAGLDNGMCASGVQNGGGAVNILGDVFLRNVFAVFDVGGAQMHFAAHKDY